MTTTPETLDKYAWARRYGWQAPVADIRSELYDALKASEKRLEAAEKWRRVAEILRSVVKSGEPWTPTLEAEWDAALAREKK